MSVSSTFKYHDMAAINEELALSQSYLCNKIDESDHAQRKEIVDETVRIGLVSQERALEYMKDYPVTPYPAFGFQPN